MSLQVALNTATSGLLAAQAGLRVVSDNIANVNTPGYVRKTINQQQLVVNGQGQGVNVTGVKRVTDQYLQLASMTAGSESARWDAYSEYIDNAQALFGDPSGKDYFFSRLNDVYAAFAGAADDPSSSLLRTQALSDVQDFVSESARINGQLNAIGESVDTQVGDDITRANELLKQVASLNIDIRRAQVTGGDPSGSENIQSQLLNELSTLMNVRVSPRDTGGVTVRSPEGITLADDQASTLAYNRTDTTRGYISATTPGVSSTPQPITVSGGAIRGLLDLRDEKLPQLSDQLGEFVARASEELNAAHNASTAFPAPTTLTGRNTGLDLPTAISGFTGATTVAVLSPTGTIMKRVAVDFTAGTLSADGGPAVAFTPGTFLTLFNVALGGQGWGVFSNGTLTLQAALNNGISVDEGSSMKAGKAFSHFFGLNDIVRSSGFATYDTGLSATDAHGFTAGQQITFTMAQPDGKPIRDVTVTVPALTTMQDLINSLNNNTTGIGLYGAFSLDSRGQLSFAGSPPSNATLSVASDNTARGAGGPSFSQLFGIGVTERSARANTFTVNPILAADPTKLALGRLDLTVAAGTPAIRAGDGRGALALAQSGDVNTQFQAAGQLGKITLTVSRYAAEFGGSIGRDAAGAEDKKASATAVQTEADARRQSVEGVNIDEELVRLTTYQQAFNASARMIQASKDLFDVLANLL